MALYKFLYCILYCIIIIVLLRVTEYSAKSLKVTQGRVHCAQSLENSRPTIRKFGYGFLFAFHSNYAPILYYFVGKRDFDRISRFFFIPHLHSTPPLGGPRRNITMRFATQKLEWWIYQTVKKFEDMFIHFDTIHERVGQTDRHRTTALAALKQESRDRKKPRCRSQLSSGHVNSRMLRQVRWILETVRLMESMVRKLWTHCITGHKIISWLLLPRPQTPTVTFGTFTLC